jgi:hypothetical protein
LTSLAFRRRWYFADAGLMDHVEPELALTGRYDHILKP